MLGAVRRWLSSRKRTIMVDGKPYLTRYYLFGVGDREKRKRLVPFSIFLHHFHASDGARDLHSHPWNGTSLILSGGYVEERARVTSNTRYAPGGIHRTCPFDVTYHLTPVERREFRPGMVNRIGQHDVHLVELLDEKRGCWTLFVAGKRRSDWGFVDRATGKFTHWTEIEGAVP